MSKNYKCAGCGLVADKDEMFPVYDVLRRIKPGDTFTDAECPMCRALCYPTMVDSPFKFVQPGWLNTGTLPANASEAMQRAHDVTTAYYAMAAQCGIHAMIEWCGVMAEHVKMLQEAMTVYGVDPRHVDQHHAGAIEVPSYMVAYIAEKLGCQLKPFIRADRSAWRRSLEDWFEGAGQHIVCEVICQKPAVSLHATEADAIEHAVGCAMENLCSTDNPEDRAETAEGFADALKSDNRICEGDYEIYMLIPTR